MDPSVPIDILPAVYKNETDLEGHNITDQFERVDCRSLDALGFVENITSTSTPGDKGSCWVLDVGCCIRRVSG